MSLILLLYYSPLAHSLAAESAGVSAVTARLDDMNSIQVRWLDQRVGTSDTPLIQFGGTAERGDVLLLWVGFESAVITVTGASSSLGQGPNVVNTTAGLTLIMYKGLAQGTTDTYSLTLSSAVRWIMWGVCLPGADPQVVGETVGSGQDNTTTTTPLTTFDYLPPSEYLRWRYRHIFAVWYMTAAATFTPNATMVILAQSNSGSSGFLAYDLLPFRGEEAGVVRTPTASVAGNWCWAGGPIECTRTMLLDMAQRDAAIYTSNVLLVSSFYGLAGKSAVFTIDLIAVTGTTTLLGKVQFSLASTGPWNDLSTFYPITEIGSDEAVVQMSPFTDQDVYMRLVVTVEGDGLATFDGYFDYRLVP